MSDEVAALRGSVAHLHDLTAGLGGQQLRQSAYPTEWTIADVLSHLGSGAVILRRRLEEVVDGRETEADFNQGVWDEWNAKEPEAQAADLLEADTALVAAIDAVGDGQRREFRYDLGPNHFGFDGFVGLRLNEHVLHTWDIEVALDPAAVLPGDAAGVIIDNLDWVVRFAGKPVGAEREVRIRTSDPERGFTLSLGSDHVELRPSEPLDTPDLALPSEALVRLVYGRMDPDRTPVANTATLDELRRAFPGF
jgi:uncharacterized protein (TIGR03083 family)